MGTEDSAVIQPEIDASPQAWHAASVEEVLIHFASGPNGLVPTVAAQRLAENGPNSLKEAKGTSPWMLLLAQFKSLLIWILIFAGVVSGLLGEMVDAVAILTIVVLNAAVGFYQEYHAGKSIAALKNMTSPRAKVKRAGQLQEIAATEVVLGDLLQLEPGDLVVADARLIRAHALTCVEAALTGESETVNKQVATLPAVEVPLGDQNNMVFMGTSVANGTGEALVVAVAMDTKLGAIAGLMNEAAQEESTPLQEKLSEFGRILVWVTLGVVALLFFLGMLRGTELFELFLTAVSLAVAAVPEGLPTVVTVALSLGVMRMARRKALVRKLAAVETLGSTSVICTDKTGTLTLGEMTVTALYVGEHAFEVGGQGYGPEGAVLPEVSPQGGLHEGLETLATILQGCNNARLEHEPQGWKVIGDPTEGALLAAATKIRGGSQVTSETWPRYHENPFDSERKRSSVVLQTPDGQLRVLVNGAPDALIGLCSHILGAEGVRPMTDADRAALHAQINSMAHRALRVLGSAQREIEPAAPEKLTAEFVERDLVFVGLAGMYDPPRSEVKEAIRRCHNAGIRTVMITGDHPETAISIARELGIAPQGACALSGRELDNISNEELEKRVVDIAVYARVTAAHKLRIIRAWQANDAVVAMTGDGVNDAPAVTGADIGIAMGRAGTEVTRQAADMVITDDNFATIVIAVEEGRGIYDNIRKALQYLLAGNTGELLLMTLCLIIGLPSPLLPIHLLWINLVTDGLPALCLATDPIDKAVMKQRPRHRFESITNPRFLRSMALTGCLTAAVAFVVYLYVLRQTDVETARSYAFTVLVMAELLRSFGARSQTTPLWRIPFFGNRNLVLVVAAALAFQLYSQYNAVLGSFLKTTWMPLAHFGVLLALGAIPLLLLEAVKVLRGRYGRP